VNAGLHLMVNLPAGIDESALLRAAHAESIDLHGAADYRVRPRPEQPALVLGYGCARDPLIREGIERLAGLVRASSIQR
jgi:GntR family transcriptional regulator / MocR family aminotransferase